MEHVSVFPFALNSAGELVICVRRDGEVYRNLGGAVQSHYSPLHAASLHFLKHSRTLLSESQIDLLLQKKPLLPEDDSILIRETLAKLTTLPHDLFIRNVHNHLGFLVPVPFVEAEVLNTHLTDTSLHWIRISMLFSVEEYQQFFTAYDLALLSQINTHHLKLYLNTRSEEQTAKIGLLNTEDEAIWQYHFEALVLSNCLGELYRFRDIKWIFYETDLLPTNEEVEELSALIVFGWRNKWADGVAEFLLRAMEAKKMLVLGSVSNLVCALLLKSRFEEEEETVPDLVAKLQKGEKLDFIETTHPELYPVVLSETYYKQDYLPAEQGEQAHEPVHLFALASHITDQLIAHLPDTFTIVGSKQEGHPVVYNPTPKLLIVHGHPEFSPEFIEEKLSPELVQMGLCSEELLHETEQSWKVPNPHLAEIRELCQHFLSEAL